MIMLDPHFYNTIERPAFAEFKDRGSRFLAYAFPVHSTKQFKSRLKELKAEHPKAVHHCFAYRLGFDMDHYRVSDDGEPSGTAGRPILGQMDSRNLTNLAIVVVRYFGGTLLGVPGLISAYKTAASLVLQTVPVARKDITTSYILRFDYTVLNDIMTMVKRHACSIKSQELQLFCSMELEIPKKKEAEILGYLKKIKGVEIGPAPNELNLG